MAPKKAKSVLSGLKLDAKRYVPLLTKLMAESESLQNNPAQGLYPREDNCSQHVLEALAPYSQEGGPLTVERVSFAEGRGNVIITYKGTGSGSIAFVGSHMDVVPANPETWKRDPFKLTVEGDHLYGRGATDCLGHVALLTELMMGLAIERPALQRTVTAVMIANEENGVVEGIGVDKLVQTGKLDHIKQGPVIWVDCADSQPCIGTAGSVTWFFKATGKLFHSGARREPSEPSDPSDPSEPSDLAATHSRPRPATRAPRAPPRLTRLCPRAAQLPHKGVNALELANTAMAELQDRFYAKFKPVPEEKAWSFMTGSTMKPTQVKTNPNPTPTPKPNPNSNPDPNPYP